MTSSTVLFLAIRAVHVLLAAAWLGTIAFIALILSPAIDDIGAGGAPVMTALGRRGIHAFIASIGGITVLTGIWLYWWLTARFDPAASATTSARVIGAGGAAGILALILGGAIVGRGAKKLTDLGEKTAATTDDKMRASLLSDMTATKRRVGLFTKIVLVLQVIALVCMAIGHYV